MKVGRRLSSRRLEMAWLMTCLGLGAGLYWHRISQWSIWHDESYTAMLISYDWSEILRRTALDVHPPLFYLILKFWTGLFGNSLLAMRSLSVICALGLIIVAYCFIKELFGARAARLAALLVTIGPYILRYAQEARMYMLVALILLIATYLLVLARKRHRSRLLYFYAVLMGLAAYTHYYALFLIPVHWLYLLFSRGRYSTKDRRAVGLGNPHWWGANLLILGLLAPWLPVAYRQFTSIQGAFWILPINPTTIPATMIDFLIYRLPWALRNWLGVVAAVLVGGLLLNLGLAIRRNRFERPSLVLLVMYTLVPILIIFGLSLPPFQPVYNNRYFSLTAVAFYLLLGVLVYIRPLNQSRNRRLMAIVVIVLTLAFGSYNVKQIGNFNPDRHEHYSMRTLAEVINQGYQPGDAIVSTNLSTYFDIRYHNRTPATVRLRVIDRPDGKGNTSLIYDRDDILLFSYEELEPPNGRIWLVTDAIDTNPEVPSQWTKLLRVQKDYAAVEQYQIDSSPHLLSVVQ